MPTALAARPPTATRPARRSAVIAAVAASDAQPAPPAPTVSRRTAFAAALAAGVLALSPLSATAAAGAGLGAGAPAEEKVLCDAACEAALKDAPLVELPSGLSYKDITPGTGPTPPTGYQVVAHYVAMTPAGRVFDSSLTRGAPYDIRVGSGQIVAGLDEGIATMKVGGVRRVFVPGALAFPKGLPSGPGRPRVPPASPVVFDVQLLYIPGLDDE